MRKWISARACARDPSISHATINLACLIFCNSICTFVISNASMRFHLADTLIGMTAAITACPCPTVRDFERKGRTREEASSLFERKKEKSTLAVRPRAP
eukprot:1153411-Pelagomonas_calceolata.AAC.4